MEVKIICGGYGLPSKRGSKLILCGQTAEVPEQEAKRLIALGLAVPVKDVPETQETEATTHAPSVTDTPDPDKEQETEAEVPAADMGEDEPEESEVDLSDLKVEELKALCKQAGIDTKGLRSKADLIAAYEAQTLPELGAEDPI